MLYTTHRAYITIAKPFFISTGANSALHSCISGFWEVFIALAEATFALAAALTNVEKCTLLNFPKFSVEIFGKKTQPI